MGSQALMTGGAVTAIVSDGSSAWYNPAGLATLKRASFDIHGSTYGISYNTAKHLFTLPDGTSGSGSVVDWQLIPTVLSYARRLSDKVVGAFGVFVPHYTDVDLRSSLDQPNGSHWTFGADQFSSDYTYILSVAVKTTETFRWGVALHGKYTSNEEMIQIGFGTPGTPDSPYTVLSSHEVIDDYGLRLGLGLQWQALPRLALGAALQTPSLTGFRDVTEDTVSGVADQAGTSFAASHNDGVKGVWELSSPLALRLGAAYQFDRVQLLLDGSFSTRVDSSHDLLDRDFSGNARLGVLFKTSDTITVGSGVFSDLNNQRGRGVDFLGAVLGVRFAENYHLRENGLPLTFSTTVGVRYAYGWGKTQGLKLNADLSADESVTSVRVQVHEAAINLGGGVSY